MTSPESQLYASAPVEQLEIGDATLALRRFGQGPALLLVHGWPLHGYTWRKLLPQLTRHHTCYVVDLAGLGDSDWSQLTDFSFPAHARRLKQLVDRLGLARYSVLAHNTGGTIARCLVLIDAPRVDKLALINTEIPGHRPPWIPLYQALMRLPGSALVFRLQLRLRWFLRSGMGFGGCFHDLNLIDGEFHEQFVAPYIRSSRRTEGMARYLIGLPWQIVDAMAHWHAEMRLPVLLVWGEDDPTFPVARARIMAKQFPDCRELVAIPRTKLLPQEEQPQAVADAVLRFLADARP